MNDKEQIERLTKQLTAATVARNQLRDQSKNKDEVISRLREQLQAVQAERDELRKTVALLGARRPT
jgi:septal ring factor EnvC (AmiA/AmiB activator)